ncbi:Alcohol dehydrogenase superfamily, zinc-type [Moelleriella libera RCEF 2490]|uniref:Alcohol dehydrogenase superfamily, zinc-type n=1 Tax=Moelleriella libera RCEF 2490 TaxID=1081109 RepID=A0A167ZMY4_9HYPO|nr:Alcohol dehydrogenase superfamily, zinc-type [Moelleriella libera RCEF 2490]
MPTFTVFKGSKDGVVRQATTTKPDELKGDNVLVRITASGLCGTDLHYTHADMVLGHEGVGVIERVGPAVRSLKAGDRVGWGYEVDSCGACADCLSGAETFCPERALYGEANLDQGSFASHAIWREAFLHSIPDDMPDEHAAPLQCGGATIFTALLGVAPGETVGIMGVGGLGHIAIQFAAKMGCRVVVFSGTDSKREQALNLGAHEFIATKGATELGTRSLLNRLLVTTSAQPAWDLILPVMAPRSVIYPLSVSDKPFEMPYMPLIFKGIRVQGSMVATRNVHRRMLEFAAFHGIKPIVEKYPMTEDGIKGALERLAEGKVVFRAVMMN